MIGGVVNAVMDTGVRLLTGQEVSLKTIGSSFVEGCVASAVGTGTAKLASKATSAVGKYAINKAGGAAARTAVGVIRGDSAKDIAKSVGVGFLADNVLDGVSSKISKIRTERANAKVASTKSSSTRNIRTIQGSGRRKTNSVVRTANAASQWLGKGTKVKTNKYGDKIFVSADSLRQIRFDINHTYPHLNVHAHLEYRITRRSAWIKSGPLYPRGVPKR